MGDVSRAHGGWRDACWGFLIGALALNSGFCIAEDWPQWRGPRRDGVSLETGLLTIWPASGPQLAWQASGLGTGYSSVVVENGRVWTLGAVAGEVVVSACRASTGERLWQTSLGPTSRNPCSTPTADGDRLYALGPDGQLACLDAVTGEIRWRRSLLDDFGGRLMSGRGYGESPLVDGDRLICTPGGPDAELVALEKQTGAVVWRTRFPELGEAGREGAAFSSCVPGLGGGVRQFVQLHGRGLVGVAADDGRLLWSHNAICNQTANIPTPVVSGDWVFAANGYNAGSVLLRLAPDPDAPAGRPGVRATEVYTLSGGLFQNHHGGVVRIGDRIFGGHGSNNGLPTCLDLPTGRILWKKRGPSTGSAAVVAVGQQLIFRYQTGHVALLTPHPGGFQVDGTLQIPGAGEDSWAHPVVAGGRLFLREQETLYVHDLREGSGESSDANRDDPSNPQTEAARDPDLERLVEAGWPARRLPRLAESPNWPATATDRWLMFARSHAEKSPPLVCRCRDSLLSATGQLNEVAWRSLRQTESEMVIDLQGLTITPGLLKQVVSIPGLVGLDLQLCVGLETAGLREVAQAANLRWLGLAGTGVAKAELSELRPLRRLVALDLEGCERVTDETVEVLPQFPGLRGLNLRKTAFEKQTVTDAATPTLASLTHLERLDLTGTRVTDQGLKELAKLTRLRELNLGLLAVSPAGLNQLETLVELRRLELPYSEGFAGPRLNAEVVPLLQQLSRLEQLDLTGAQLGDRELESLAGLPGLRWLRVARTQVTPAGLERLTAKHPGLEIRR